METLRDKADYTPTGGDVFSATKVRFGQLNADLAKIITKRLIHFGQFVKTLYFCTQIENYDYHVLYQGNYYHS